MSDLVGFKSFLNGMEISDVLINYVDLKDRDLGLIHVSDDDPPGLSSTALDVAFWLERIRGYYWWIDYLNGVRKKHGQAIKANLDQGEGSEAAFKSGLQEVGFHLIAISADAAAKRFRLVNEKIGAELEDDLLQRIGRYGTFRSDLEHPWDERHIDGKFGRKIFNVERGADGDIQAFVWGYGRSDTVASRKQPVSFSDVGIGDFQDSLLEGLVVLRKFCIDEFLHWVENDSSIDVLEWMLMRTVVTSSVDPSTIED